MRLILLVLLSLPLIGGTYWVSPTGAAAWASCESATALSGAAACALSTPNTNAVAGDIIYLRGGTYSITGTSFYAINPSNSGTLGSRITWKAHTGETPVIEGDVITSTYGARITTNYIIIDGITFHNSAEGIWIIGGDYNEVKNCIIYMDAVYDDDLVYALLPIVINTGGTHNWIHHNTIHGYGADALGEGSDAIRIGADEDQPTYNTIENNTIYHMGHALGDDYGRYEVWANNIGHNEGWKPASNIYGTATGGSSTSLINTAVNFTTAGVSVGWKVFAVSDHDNFVSHGTVTSISTTTNTNDTLNYSGTLKPTFSAGIKYTVGPGDYAPDPVGSYPGDGKYGHRCFGLSENNSVTAKYTLFEGNRAGYASTNPNNRGSDGLTLGSPGNIIRYNAFFGADGPAINLKAYPSGGGANNAIYNNTAYKNGQVQVGQGVAEPIAVAIFDAGGAASTGNKLKNNLFYQNGTSVSSQSGDYYGGTKTDHTWAGNMCDATDAALGCTAGTPTFVNASLADMTSLVLPNLNAASASSPQVNGGTYLTQASGSGTGSSTLIVDDASYFQDGTWGSDLARGVTLFPDHIAIGTVSNTVAISSINYATNTITLASAKTWDDNANIWLYKKSDGTVVLNGSAPDYGAYEYTATTSPTKLGGGTWRLTVK
jgi:hypothetical protein